MKRNKQLKQRQILEILSKNKENNLTKLEKLTHLTLKHLIYILKELKSNNYITIEKFPKKGKPNNKNIKITSKGKSILKSLNEIYCIKIVL